MTTSVLIIDDDIDSRIILSNYIRENHPKVVIAGETGTIKQSIELINSAQPDLLLLDISLTDGTAFEMLEILPDRNFEVIFITAYDMYAIKAFRLAAVDYLLKPVSFTELGDAIAKVEHRIEEKYFRLHWGALIHNTKQQNQTAKKLAIATSDGFLFAELHDIVRLESHSNYTYFYFSKGPKMVSSRTLGYYEEILPEEDFCRIHHSHIINISMASRYIKGGAGGTVVMYDGTELPVSQRKKEDMFRHLVGEKKI